MRERVAALAALIGLAAAATAQPAPPAPAPAPVAPRRPGPERLRFPEALQRALARNPSVAVAQEEVRRAEALVRQAQATWLPILTANGVYTRLDNDRQLAGRIFVNKEQETANLNLSVPLLAPSRWLASSRAGEGVEVGRASAEDVRRTVGLATGRAFLAVLASRRNLEVSERARDTARAHSDTARARRAAGVGNRLDEVRAAQELATDEAQLQTGLAGLVRAQEALGVLVGGEGPADAAEDPALPAPPALDAALHDARTQRGDVRAQEQRLQAAAHAVRDSWADYAPLLTASFQPFYQHPATTTQPETGWQAQLVLALPLYDGGLRYGLRRERKALEAEARSNLEGLLRQAASEVRTAFEALLRADEGLGSAREASRLAAEALQLADLAYRAGAINNLEVIDAERRARDADATAAAAEDQARQARLDLLAASGHFP